MTTISICGAGTMGRGIALAAARGGFRTLLVDLDANILASAKDEIQHTIRSWHQKEKITMEELSSIEKNLYYSTFINDCVADLVIEAIVERMDAKTKLFKTLAEINAPDTILASNTSSLSINAIAENIPDPTRFAGLHFFNPAALMKLVEIIKGSHSSEHTIQTLTEFSISIGKIPVICKDAPGFIVNHVARPYYLEALRLFESGIPVEQVDEVMEATGFKMGPFRLMDLIGNDINYAVSCSVYSALGEPSRLQPSPIQKLKVDAGELGRKTGKGYYQY